MSDAAKPAADRPSNETASTPRHDPIVSVSRLSVRFGSQQVLRDVSVDIRRGETLVVIGESGCGKTVLLKALIGLVAPTSGSVVVEGQDLATLGDKAITRLRTRLGFVFQNAALFDSLSVADNVAFPLREHRRIDREGAYREAIRRLNEVGLPASVMAKKPAELSGGMRKRVGLARALVMEPDLLLYDEPTTGLDPIMSDVINELILRTRNARKGDNPVTGVVVTHDMHSALKLADRVVMLYPLARLSRTEPQIVFQGTPAELKKCDDPRVSQFVRGEARDRLLEMQTA
ncbi:MAG: ABC transporter ATP-binding protein [Lacipirellulaceae bacterium]